MKNSKRDVNMEIYEILGDFLLTYPEIRFVQALWCLGIVNNEDRFYERSEETLKKLKDKKTLDKDI